MCYQQHCYIYVHYIGLGEFDDLHALLIALTNNSYVPAIFYFLYTYFFFLFTPFSLFSVLWCHDIYDLSYFFPYFWDALYYYYYILCINVIIANSASRWIWPIWIVPDFFFFLSFFFPYIVQNTYTCENSMINIVIKSIIGQFIFVVVCLPF